MMENELSSPRITASTVLSGSVSPIAPGSPVVKHRRPRRAGLLKWIPSDRDQFIRTENVVLQPVSGFYEQKEIASLNTIYYMHKPGAQKGLHSTPKETAQNEPPLLLFHGFGTGLGLWSICWMDLLQMGDVYAIDLPGLAGSKRFPYNGKNHKDAIQYFLQHISAWMHESKIATPFRVMGHSLGGYIAANFARAFPEWVTEVILVDPWGVPCAKENDKRMDRLPTGLKVALTVAHVVSPLAVVRSLGPLGPNLFLKSRRRITEQYRHMLTDTKALGDYLYHCNTFEPTGEAAFRQLTNNRLTAYEPISDWLLKELKPGIRVAFIYGQNTWIDYSAGEALVKKKNETHGHTHTSYKGFHDLYWQVNIIPNAGHNVFVDQPLSFVRCVTQFLYHGDPPPYPRQSIVPLSIPSPPHLLVRSETMPIFNEQQDV